MPRLIVLLVVFVAAAAVRGSLLFANEMVPGMNGAYYLVQARSLLEKASLAIPDLPLVFLLHACAAQTLEWCGMAEREAVTLAVKLGDSLLPALSVIPIMALAERWSERKNALDTVLAALAALLVPAGGIALGMVGDFQKNSFGIALLCGLVWALWRLAESPGWRRGAVAALFLGGIGLTHIGVFGTALILCLTTLGLHLAASGSRQWRHAALLAALALPVAALCAGMVFWKFDPARVRRLLGAFSDPAEFLGAGPMPGPPPGLAAMNWAPALVFFLLVAPALVMAWRNRAALGAGKVAVVAGLAVTVVAITGPWVQGDKLMRLQMNAAPLALLCLLFALLRLPRAGWRAGIGFPVLGVLLLSAGQRWQAGSFPIISQETRTELQIVSLAVEKPEQTLVVARHGLEWWTAWELRTHIAQMKALRENDWQKYEFVWFLEETRGGRGGPGGPPFLGRNGPPGAGPPMDSGWLGGVRRFLLALAHPAMMPPRPGGNFPGGGRPQPPVNPGPPPGINQPMGPPPGDDPRNPGPFERLEGEAPPGFGPPPGFNPPPGFGPPPGRARGGGPMSSPMPPEAEILHEGNTLRLGWVREAPARFRTQAEKGI